MRYLTFAANILIVAVIELFRVPISPLWRIGIMVGALALIVIADHYRWLFGYFHTGERIRRREVAKHEVLQRNRVRERDRVIAGHLREIKRTPWLGKPQYDLPSGRIRAPIQPQRTWRGRVMNVAVWFANRPWWVEWPITERSIF